MNTRAIYSPPWRSRRPDKGLTRWREADWKMPPSSEPCRRLPCESTRSPSGQTGWAAPYLPAKCKAAVKFNPRTQPQLPLLFCHRKGPSLPLSDMSAKVSTVQARASKENFAMCVCVCARDGSTLKCTIKCRECTRIEIHPLLLKP